MTTPFERLQKLVKNAGVTHPDRVRGCMFTIRVPPGFAPNHSWPFRGNEKPVMPLGIEWMGTSPFQYSAVWDNNTGDYLKDFRSDWGNHWTIEFCLDAWESWQAGEWDNPPQNEDTTNDQP